MIIFFNEYSLFIIPSKAIEQIQELLLNLNFRTLGLCRRRIGRGGRIITDRAHHPAQTILENLPLTNDDSELNLNITSHVSILYYL